MFLFKKGKNHRTRGNYKNNDNTICSIEFKTQSQETNANKKHGNSNKKSKESTQRQLKLIFKKNRCKRQA